MGLGDEKWGGEDRGKRGQKANIRERDPAPCRFNRATQRASQCAMKFDQPVHVGGAGGRGEVDDAVVADGRVYAPRGALFVSDEFQLDLLLVNRRSVERTNDSFHVDQERFLHETIDDQQSVRRIHVRLEKLRKKRGAQAHEVGNVLRVNEKGGELGDVVEVRADTGQHAAQVFEDLLELRIEIAGADHAAVVAYRELSGDENKFAGFHSRQVRVETLRRAGAFRVDVLDVVAHELTLSERDCKALWNSIIRLP